MGNLQREYYEEREINIIQILRQLWGHRKRILKFLIIFFLVGLFIAIFSPKEYTASTVFIPQTNTKASLGGNLGGLAAMAGINLSGGTSIGIPPKIYPKIIKSIPFRKELLKVKLNFKEIEKPITYKEYYSKHRKFNLLNFIKKYTIGLPSVILGALRKNEEDNSQERHDDDGIYRLSIVENMMFKSLDNQLNIINNDKEGFISLSFSMPEALPAAQMAKKAQQLLQQSITKFKVQKAEEELAFIQKRYDELAIDFKKKQNILASYKDRNMGLMTSRSQTYLNRLEADYRLSSTVFSELAKQLETQKIKVKENTPVFTVIQPVSVPVQKSKPKRLLILTVWVLFGLIMGVLSLFIKELIKKIKNE